MRQTESGVNVYEIDHLSQTVSFMLVLTVKNKCK